MTRRRAVLAGLFAVLYPGLGHVYLREWFRALAWFGLALLTAALVVPADVLSAAESGGIASVLSASGSLPLASLAALTMVRLFNVIDAVWLALAPPPTVEADATTCPECGGDVDTDLDFCHWCTARLDRPGEAPTGAARSNRFSR